MTESQPKKIAKNRELATLTLYLVSIRFYVKSIMENLKDPTLYVRMAKFEILESSTLISRTI